MKLTDIFNRVDALSPDEAKQLLSENKNAVLLDVREPKEYEAEHLSELPDTMSGIMDKMKDLDPSKPIITY
jgi:rhodanese-related sulfurtransferase